MFKKSVEIGAQYHPQIWSIEPVKHRRFIGFFEPLKAFVVKRFFVSKRVIEAGFF